MYTPRLSEPNEITWQSYLADLEDNKSRGTIENYARQIARLDAHFSGRDLLTLSTAELRGYFAAVKRTATGETPLTYYARTAAFYAWAARGEWTDTNPMARIARPRHPKTIMPIADEAAVRAARAACVPGPRATRRAHLEVIRDAAMISVWMSPGSPRASEMAALDKADVDLPRRQLTIREGKGGKSRITPLSPAACRDLAKWLRVRGEWPTAATCAALWLGKYGRMTRSGMGYVLAQRCVQAGVPRVNPHSIRHLMTHKCLAAGVPEGAVMQYFGWSRREMMDRYGAQLAQSRALSTAHEMMSAIEAAA